MHKRPELPEGFQGQVYKDKISRGGELVVGYMIQFMDILSIGFDGEVIGSQQHQPSNWSVGYVLVGSI